MSLISRVGAQILQLLYRNTELEIYRAPLLTLRTKNSMRTQNNVDVRFVVMEPSAAMEFCQASPEILRRFRSYFVGDSFCQKCLMAFAGDSLAGWSMLHIGAREWPLTETGTFLELQSYDAVFYSAYTVPEFRGARVNWDLMLESARIAAASGAQNFVAWHVRGNEAPRRNMTKLGLMHTERHSSRWLLGKRVVMRKTRMKAMED